MMLMDRTLRVHNEFSRIITWCVSVAKTSQGVAVRDTKDKTKKTLFFKPDEWRAFVKGVKNGEFDY